MIRYGTTQVRECPVCKKTIERVFQEFRSRKEFDRYLQEKGEENVSVYPLPCPECDRPDAPHYPTHIRFYFDGKVIFEIPIGSNQMPIVSTEETELSFAVTEDPKKIEEYNKALAVFEQLPLSHFEDFINQYVEETISKHKENEVWRDWEKFTWENVFLNLGLPLQPTKGDYRRVAREHAREVLRLHMERMVARVQYLSPMVWAETEALQKYDPWSVQYLVLHIPLPEALEDDRTELIGRFVTRKGDLGSEALFRRIRDLQRKLDSQRSKTQSLIDQLNEQRRKQAELERKLSEAYARIRELEQRLTEAKTVALPDRRKAEWKGLIAELRADVERLEAALREANRTVEITVPAVDEGQEAPQQEIDVAAVLEGKTVAIIGGPHEHLPHGDYPCRVLYHRGERAEGLEHLLNVADVIVLVISFISHGTMWYVREEALERDKPVMFTRQTNVDLLLQRAAEVLEKA